MTSALRPRRSVLYMPGSNARALEKSRTLPADCLILDMEDAVAPNAKALAREQIINAVSEGGYAPREIIIRINSLDSEWGLNDLQAVARLNPGPDAILLPKIERPEQIHDAIKHLDEAGAPAGLPIWIMIETPCGVLDIDAIAGAHERLQTIVMGTSDLAKDTRVRHTTDRIGFIGALNLCVLAARAHGKVILDGVHLDLNDDAGLIATCEQGRDMGFDGRTLIHPKQIDAANRIFAPSADEVDNAQRIIDAWQQAQAEGKGVVVIDGRLVENLHVEEAGRVLALAEAINNR